MLAGVLAGLLAGALWGLVFVAPRMVQGFSSVDLASGRFLAYGAVALGMSAWAARREALPTGRQLAAAAGLSLLGFTGYYLLLVLAIRDAGTEVPTLIIGTIPLWVMLLGKPGHLRWRALVPGLLLTAAGLALMMASPQAGGAPAGPHYWRGIAFALVSLACWTAFALLNATWLKRHPEVNATAWANWLGLATGAGALLLWGVAGTEVATLRAQPDWALFLWLCLGTGLGAAWLATILWNVASRRLSASLCGQLIVSETLFALAYSFAWDGRWPSPAQAAAVVLFTLGILASIKAHR
jgi:drug/metabolite transporter (DMT)-like permease